MNDFNGHEFKNLWRIKFEKCKKNSTAPRNLQNGTASISDVKWMLAINRALSFFSLCHGIYQTIFHQNRINTLVVKCRSLWIIIDVECMPKYMDHECDIHENIRKGLVAYTTVRSHASRFRYSRVGLASTTQKTFLSRYWIKTFGFQFCSNSASWPNERISGVPLVFCSPQSKSDCFLIIYKWSMWFACRSCLWNYINVLKDFSTNISNHKFR